MVSLLEMYSADMSVEIILRTEAAAAVGAYVRSLFQLRDAMMQGFGIISREYFAEHLTCEFAVLTLRECHPFYAHSILLRLNQVYMT